ncbi:MAG: cytochrome c oxidase subunit I, partial [Bacteroidetes bacterium]|nr:cytochrome c oxidase subunit I [Bacteroidota bacterium]
TVAAQAIFAYNFFYSIFYGKVGPQNPWKATTLEWTTGIKPIHGNWEGPIPHVYRWAYDYSKLNKEGTDYVIPGQDYIPQTVPLQPNEDELNH